MVTVVVIWKLKQFVCLVSQPTEIYMHVLGRQRTTVRMNQHSILYTIIKITIIILRWQIILMKDVCSFTGLIHPYDYNSKWIGKLNKINF